MKMFLITLLSIFSSINALASQPQYVACRAANSVEYDIAIEFVLNKATSISTLESDFKYYAPIENKDIVSVIYTSEYDTNLGYDLFVNNTSLEKISVATWTSGNDSDNYIGIPTNSNIECHLLKSKPINSILVGGNVQAYVAVENLSTNN
jgi:hypothetical protein